MSKRRHRDPRKINNNIDYKNNIVENNQPFGINIQQLLNMLGGNMDINGVANILSLMNRNGFDLSSINNQMGFQKNNGKCTTSTGYTEASKTSKDDKDDKDDKDGKDDTQNIDAGNSDIENIDEIEIMDSNEDDDNIKFLKNIRKIVELDKQVFINRIIEMYVRGDFKNN